MEHLEEHRSTVTGITQVYKTSQIGHTYKKTLHELGCHSQVHCFSKQEGQETHPS